MSGRARAAVVVALLALGAASVAACGDDIRCYAPDESACGISSDAAGGADSGAGADADADAAADAEGGADAGADADAGEGG